MKIVLCGGLGHVGSALIRHFMSPANDLVVLSRRPTAVQGVKVVQWDGCTLGKWKEEFEGADVVINLAGQSVNCRYTEDNLKVMMDSRVDSTRIVGQAIAHANRPPPVWLQSSTATIYAHRFDAPNDEATGIIGGDEPNAPYKWVASIEIAKAWEKALNDAPTPRTRKVAMRSAMTMTIDKGSVFDVFQGLAKKGLGGRIGSGKQYVSWIHEKDFCRAVKFLIQRDDLSGAVNLASPNPLPQADFSLQLRNAVGAKVGLPLSTWLLEIGCALLKTESELVLKSRRVIPTRLIESGFKFEFPTWSEACKEINSRSTKKFYPTDSFNSIP